MGVSVVGSSLASFKGCLYAIEVILRYVATKDALYLLNDLIEIKHNLDMKKNHGT
jgi:hypothetical protein